MRMARQSANGGSWRFGGAARGSPAAIVLLWVLILTLAAASSCDPRPASATGNGEEEQERAEDSGEERSGTRRDEQGRTASGDQKRSPEALRERALDPSMPLPDRVDEVLSSIEFGPRRRDLTRDSHYWVSNEEHHHLYRSHIQGLGGVLMGVGTDQNYLMAGWAKSPILLMVDFDEQIRNVHHLYGLVFNHVDSRGAFIEQWSDAEAEEIRSWIRQKHAGDAERIEALLKTLEWSNDSIYYRLRTTAEQYEKADIPTFLTDDEQFEFVQGLWERGRVFPIRGDLTGETAMLEIASALRRLDLKIGLLYVSNAEQYFEFTPAYRRNVVVQPFREEAVVLRTRPMEALGLPEEGDYHYNIQKASNFSGWLRYNRLEEVAHLMLWHNTEAEQVEGLSFIRKEPPRSDPPPDVAGVGEAYDLEISQSAKH